MKSYNKEIWINLMHEANANWDESISGITKGKIVKSGYQYYVDITFTDSYI